MSELSEQPKISPASIGHGQLAHHDGPDHLHGVAPQVAAHRHAELLRRLAGPAAAGNDEVCIIAEVAARRGRREGAAARALLLARGEAVRACAVGYRVVRAADEGVEGGEGSVVEAIETAARRLPEGDLGEVLVVVVVRLVRGVVRRV